MQHFKHYLLGSQFVIRPAHSLLTWLHNFRDVEALVGRLLTKLAVYNCSIEHRNGTIHRNVDGLSRQPPQQLRHKCKTTNCTDCFPTETTNVSCLMNELEDKDVIDSLSETFVHMFDNVEDVCPVCGEDMPE